MVLVLLPLSVYADGQISKEKIDSHGKQRSYYLYVPESVKTSGASSLVVLLLEPVETDSRS
jgi:poly(3-hydroxybutyrate) depolymerase